MTTFTKDEIATTARIAGKTVTRFEGDAVIVHSDGCKGGVRWDPVNCSDDAMELGFWAGVTLGFSFHPNVRACREAIVFQALSKLG
jgi:hypothetical protein